MTSPLRRCEIWSSYQCDGGTRQAIIPRSHLTVCDETTRITGEDELVVELPVAAPSIAEWQIGRVLRLAYDDETFDEWRIAGFDEGTAGAGKVRARCQSVLFELATYALASVTNGTVVTYDKTYTGLVPSGIVTDVLTLCPVWWSAGTITPTTRVTVVASWSTPLEVLRATVMALVRAGVACELQVTRNGTSGYRINIVTAIGASATTPDVRSGKNLLALSRTRSRKEVATRAYAQGTGSATMAGALWSVDSILGLVIGVAGIEDCEDPIAYDDQLNGMYLRKRDGTFTLITDSDASAQTVTVASAAGITALDWVSFHASAAGGDVTYLTVPGATTKGAVVPRDQYDAESNLVPNPVFARWSAGLPVDWTEVDPSTVTTITQDAARVLNGQYSARIDATGGASPSGLRTGVAQHLPSADASVVSTRVSFYLDVAGSGDMVFTISLRANGGGLIVADSYDTAANPSYRDRWLVSEMPNHAVSAGTLYTYLECYLVNSGGAKRAYLDSAQITASATVPPLRAGSHPAFLWTAANRYLLEHQTEPASVTLTLADLERWDGNAFPYDALTLGATLNVTDTVLDITTSARISELTRRHLSPMDSTVTLGSIVNDLVRQVAA